MNLQLVPAAPDDAPLMHGVMEEAFEEHRTRLSPPSGAHVETPDDVARMLSVGGGVIAWHGDTAVGCARYEARLDRLYVSRVSVLPSFRRQGVATAMMRWMEGRARELGFSRLEVGVRMSLPSNVELYNGLGYVQTEVQPHPRGADLVGTLVKEL